MLQQPSHSQHSILLQEILERCVRLSYHDRVIKALPAGSDFITLLPPDSEPNYRYKNSESCGSEEVFLLGAKLLKSLKNKESAKEIQSLLAELTAYGASSGHGACHNEPLGSSFTRDVLVQCILLLGSKSFSHALNMIER